MKKIIFTLLACVIWQSSFAINATNEKSAEEAWQEFEADPSNMYTFLDALAASNSPQDYSPYVQKFVNKCLGRGVEWNDLFDELKETVLPKDPDVATCFAVSLCQNTGNYADIIKALDVLPKTHTFDNINVEDAVIYSDGRIGFHVNRDIKNHSSSYESRNYIYGVVTDDLYRYSTAPKLSPLSFENYGDLNEWKQIFLYQPTGDCLLGVMKKAGTRDLFYDFDKSSPGDNLELFIGFMLNRQGEKVGEKYDQYDSFAEAYDAKKDAEEMQEAAVAANSKKINDVIEKKMVAKYGRKAYNAMQMLQPYVGMPEGILRDMVIVSKDGQSFIPYVFVNVKSGYKVYFQSNELAVIKLGGQFKAPTALYISNGRVAAIKW